jgi:uncharacterized phage protein (TIGR02216 family)
MGPDRFAEGARRLAGLATRAFGWSPDTFWATTPAELAAILSASEGEAVIPLARREFEHLMERDADGRPD